MVLMIITASHIHPVKLKTQSLTGRQKTLSFYYLATLPYSKYSMLNLDLPLDWSPELDTLAMGSVL